MSRHEPPQAWEPTPTPQRPNPHPPHTLRPPPPPPDPPAAQLCSRRNTADIRQMDTLVHEAWAHINQKYAAALEPCLEEFLRAYLIPWAGASSRACVCLPHRVQHPVSRLGKGLTSAANTAGAGGGGLLHGPAAQSLGGCRSRSPLAM